MLFKRLKKGFLVFNKSAPPGVKILVFVLLLLVGVAIVEVISEGISEAYVAYKFRRLSSFQHLKIAKDICHFDTSNGTPVICFSPDPNEAIRHLEKVPPATPEYSEASKLLSVIRQQQEEVEKRQQAVARAQADAGQGGSSGPTERAENAQSNVSGTAHNNLICSRGYPKSCTKEDDGPCMLRPIMSFDRGATWVWDDGRCAEREQKKRDEDAEPYSYWPTTLRVDTDMASPASLLNPPSRFPPLPAQLSNRGGAVFPVATSYPALRLSDGEYGWMHFNLGSAYFSLENWNFALQSYEKAAELSPAEPVAAYNVALCNQRLGHFGDAVHRYEEYLRRKPNADDKTEVLERIRLLKQ